MTRDDIEMCFNFPLHCLRQINLILTNIQGSAKRKPLSFLRQFRLSLIIYNVSLKTVEFISTQICHVSNTYRNI